MAHFFAVVVMKLAIATTFLQSMNGVAKVVLKIAKEFDATIYTTEYRPESTFPEFNGLDIRVIGTGRKLGLLGRFGSGINSGLAFHNLKLDRDEFDVINAHQSPSEWVRNRNVPVLWYCHTPNREAFDLYEWRMGQRGRVGKAAYWLAIEAFKKIEYRVVPKIEYIFTNSRNSQARIKKYLKRDSEILYPGVDFREYKRGNYGKYFVYPGRIAPEKDIEYTITAFRRFSARKKGYRLKIIGSIYKDHKPHAQYYEKLKVLSAGLNVEFITNVPEERFKKECENSLAIVYSPINEDFGLVPPEAMAAYKPTIAKNEGGPIETITDSVDGFLVNSPEEMAGRMLELAERPELAEEMGKMGRKKVEKEFSWKRFMKRFREKAGEMAKSKDQ